MPQRSIIKEGDFDMETKKLANGVEIPAIGFGTWLVKDGEEVRTAVKTAIQCGYRHIDTAAYYFNEKGVGEAIAASGVPREELFITSKLWNTERGYEKTKAAIQKTLENLNLSYLDLYLIHWPASESRFPDWKELNLGSWRAMMEFYKAGTFRAIGVSNFNRHHLEPLMEAEVQPMVNQIEIHPGYHQKELRDYCAVHDILVEAWSPLGRGRVLENETLKELAEKYQKSVAQICIRWCMEIGALPLPKSVTATRIEENLQVFDFTMEQTDIERITALPEMGFSGHNPDTITF